VTHPELPYNLEAERAVLGAVIISHDALIRITSWMQSSWFYQERHQALFSTILALHQSSGATDIKTLVIALTGSGQLERVGGISYLAGLIEGALPWQVEDYAREVERCAVLRQLVNAGTRITQLGYTHDLALTRRSAAHSSSWQRLRSERRQWPGVIRHAGRSPVRVAERRRRARHPDRLPRPGRPDRRAAQRRSGAGGCAAEHGQNGAHAECR
jgi:hypothetical protein